MINHNVIFTIPNLTCDVFLFSHETSKFDNWIMGKHNGNDEYCVVIPNPMGRDVEIFSKEGDYIVLITLFNKENIPVNFTALSVEEDVAKLYIKCYDELEQQDITFYDTFNYQPEEDVEPTEKDIQLIEKDLDWILSDAKNLFNVDDDELIN